MKTDNPQFSDSKFVVNNKDWSNLAFEVDNKLVTRISRDKQREALDLLHAIDVNDSEGIQPAVKSIDSLCIVSEDVLGSN